MRNKTLPRIAAVVALLLLSTWVAAKPDPSASTKPVTFLDRESAAKAIVDDSLDPYFTKLSPDEISAKTTKRIAGDTPAQQLAECKNRFANDCVDFTADERKNISASIEKIRSILKTDYPRFAAQPWTMLKVVDELEGGMPHTRGACIVIPESVAGAFGADPSPDMMEILVHEQTHVMQRLHPGMFDKLYTDILGFKRAKKIESHKDVEDFRVVNPDGTVCDWVYPLHQGDTTRWIWPRLVLNQLDQRSLSSVDAIAVDVEPTGELTFKVKIKDGEPVTEPLANVRPYMNAMHAGFNSYHPNEVAADRFAHLFRQIQSNPNDPNLDAFGKWAKQAFK